MSLLVPKYKAFKDEEKQTIYFRGPKIIYAGLRPHQLRISYKRDGDGQYLKSPYSDLICFKSHEEEGNYKQQP